MSEEQSFEFEASGDGWLPEDDKPEHWSYEDKLKPLLVTSAVMELPVGSQYTDGDGNVDLRPFSSPVHSQRHTSSCVAQSVVKALEIKRIMAGKPHVDLSRLAVYYLARELMFPMRTNADKGTFISLACDVLRRWGVCPEADWPWDLQKIYTPPSWMAMRKAYLGKIQAFYKIRSTGNDRVDEVRRCLQAGNPVVFGTEVGAAWALYRSYNPLKEEPLTIPTIKTGRHAICIVGYQGNGNFIIENSWGENWGHGGFGYLAPEVIASDKSDDFWLIQGGWEEYKAE